MYMYKFESHFRWNSYLSNRRFEREYFVCEVGLFLIVTLVIVIMIFLICGFLSYLYNQCKMLISNCT